MYVFYDPTVWPGKRSKSKFNLKELKLSDYFDEISSSDEMTLRFKGLSYSKKQGLLNHDDP